MTRRAPFVFKMHADTPDPSYFACKLAHDNFGTAASLPPVVRLEFVSVLNFWGSTSLRPDRSCLVADFLCEPSDNLSGYTEELWVAHSAVEEEIE